MSKSDCHNSDQQECIKKKAYELWEKEGHKIGNDLHYWVNAEKKVKAAAKKQPLSATGHKWKK